MPGSPRGDGGARGLKSADRQTPGPRDHSPTEEEGLAWGELPGCVRKLSTRMGPLGTPRRPPGPSYWPVGVGLGAGQPGGPTDQGQPEDASPPPSETREAQGLLTACEDSPRKQTVAALGSALGMFLSCAHQPTVGGWAAGSPLGADVRWVFNSSHRPSGAAQERPRRAPAGPNWVPYQADAPHPITGPLRAYSRTPCSAASSA